MGGYYSDIISRQKFYDTSYSGEFTLEPGEDISKLIKLVGNYIFVEEMDIDLSELKSLKVGANVSVKDSVFGGGLTTAVNKVNLLSVNVAADMDQGELYVQIPELTKTYVRVDMGDYIGDTDELLECQSAQRELIESLPKQAEVEKLVRRYLKIALENIDNVSIGRKKELKVEGIAQKCTVLEVTIDGETMQKVMEAVLEEALKDKSLEKIIVEAANAASEDGDEIYENLTEEMEEMLDEIDGLYDDDTEMEWTVYVDSKGNIIGNVLEQETSWGKDSISILTARKGHNVAYEITCQDDGDTFLEISGTGKKSNDLLTGDFKVEYYDRSVVELKVTKLDIEKLKRGYVNGQVEATLSSELSKQLGNEIGSSTIANLVKKSSLLFDIRSSAQSMECKVTWNYDGAKYLGATLALKSDSGSKTAIPKGNSVIMIEDEDDFVDYYDEIDWNKFLTGLEKTGVLSETAEQLEDVIDDLDDLIEAGDFLRYIF